MELALGSTVNKFVVEEMIGQGGMASVYRIRHRELGVPYALKIMHVTLPELAGRIKSEGALQAGLQHPNIVTVFDMIDVSGHPALVMEYVDGPSLHAFLHAYRPNIEQIDDIARGILRGVRFAHGKGMIHRDIKPANVLLANADDAYLPKITDFGLAKSLLDGGNSHMQTRTGAVMGTPAYMAPEQFRNSKDVDHRADVYSLGVVLYELVSGQRPYEPDDLFELLEKVKNADYPAITELVPSIPDRMADAIEGAMTVSAKDRIPDTDTLYNVWCGRVKIERSRVWDKGVLKSIGERLAPASSPSNPSGLPRAASGVASPSQADRRLASVEQPKSQPSIAKPPPPKPSLAKVPEPEPAQAAPEQVQPEPDLAPSPQPEPGAAAVAPAPAVEVAPPEPVAQAEPQALPSPEAPEVVRQETSFQPLPKPAEPPAPPLALGDLPHIPVEEPDGPEPLRALDETSFEPLRTPPRGDSAEDPTEKAFRVVHDPVPPTPPLPKDLAAASHVIPASAPPAVEWSTPVPDSAPSLHLPPPAPKPQPVPVPAPARTYGAAGAGAAVVGVLLLFAAAIVAVLLFIGVAYWMSPDEDIGQTLPPLQLDKDNEQPEPIAQPEQPEPPPVEPVVEPEPPVEQPVPVAKPEPPAEQPKPEQKKPPKPKPSTSAKGTVRLTGDAAGLRLVSGGKSYRPGSVPAGTYQLYATFPGRGEVDLGVTATIEAGETTEIFCQAKFDTCRVR